jgi:membrane-associated phospholipid phosphatase
VLALPIGVGFATVYLGHHYVIDLVAGGGLALACFAVMVRGWRPGRAPVTVARPVLGSGIPALFDHRGD